METLLKSAAAGEQPIAIVLAGHNGSGKSTLWYERLADGLQIPLVNADRLTLSLLPEPGADRKLRPWASRLRDEDQRWQKLAQDGVQLFMGLAMDQGMPFAFETASHTWNGELTEPSNRRSMSFAIFKSTDTTSSCYSWGSQTPSYRSSASSPGDKKAGTMWLKSNFAAGSLERSRQFRWQPE